MDTQKVITKNRNDNRNYEWESTAHAESTATWESTT